MGGKLSAPRGERIHESQWTDVFETHEEDVSGFNERFVGCEDELCSGESSCTVVEEKCYDPQDATLTFVEGDDDLDFLCEDYKSLRAKMSCGHAVTPMSLTIWCRYLLDSGECNLVCGQTDCDVEWPFEEVCKMALLTEEELEYFEKTVFSNAAKDYLGVKSCPGCSSRVVRSDLHDLCVQCPVCTARRRRGYTFCWQCLKKWKGPAPRSDRCANRDCQNPLDILRNCPDISFEDVEGVSGCPSTRACPTCGLLVEHNRTQCKNVFCARCKVEFCFVCLKLTEECVDEDDISSFYRLCPSGVAPRQTSVPVWQRT
ncbi:hypothetical protein JOQ06_020079 [Pogonophryne albipinna]|uniref:RING-type domain-containing protein n=1 Tax=Pogonophryne albipinna TaxID=1090488 RepID=A0AAD6FV90_9TELE|nr:hypothetical protein JOQ06_020079 [Pogonophryne albipinna]